MTRAMHLRQVSISRAAVVIMVLVVSMLATSPARGDEMGSTEMVSVANDGTLGDGESLAPSISADGRYLAFVSDAKNLVPDDIGFTDVFVRDVQAGTTTRVSVSGDGSQSDDGSINPSISADGRYVAFFSFASNLVVDDTNEAGDVFVHDRQTGATERVSVTNDGDQGDGQSGGDVALSADGRHVAFTSVAGNLVEGDTNGLNDVFVRDLVAGTTTRVNLASDGEQTDDFSHGLAISADGRHVAFSSVATNLVEDDTNGRNDLFVHDTLDGTTARISVATDGTEGDAMVGSHFSLSGEGRHVAFESYAANLVPGDTNGSPDVFVRDTQMGTTTRVSLRNTGGQAKGASGGASITVDGRFVSFGSNADNLVPNDTNRSADVFVRDTELGTTTRVSVAGSGAQGNSGSGEPSVSADGRFVAFTSHAGNLVVGDSNKLADVFRRSLTACSDGVDNDGDGAMDHPDDPGCDSATDISEARVLRFDTSTTFKYRASSFKGRVSADNKRCLGKRRVVLRRANDNRVGRTTTDRDGRWSIPKPRSKGRYYATVKEQAKPAKHLDTVVCHAVKTDLLRRD